MWLQVLDCNQCLKHILVFQVPAHWSYFVDHDLNYLRITLWCSVVAQSGYLYQPWEIFISDFHYPPPSYSYTWQLCGNTWGMIVLGYCTHHTGNLWIWQHSATAMQHHDSPRVGHGHTKSSLMQLKTNPCLQLGKLYKLLSSFVMSTL